MPTSDYRQIGPIIGELLRIRPASILDVGAGYGKLGVLCREYLDDWQGDLRIDAIEPFTDYVTRSAAYGAYDDVIPTPIDRYRPEGRRWDCALLVDVLEHFEKPLGAFVLDSLLGYCGAVIVATPREPSDQGHPPPYGNAYETHRAQWRESDFYSYLVDRFVPVPGDDQIVVTLRGVA
jgi:2-polyprenyl-3-methyl-5-hydroxy-6-metoxy-1,4-benzoquinol methylase